MRQEKQVVRDFYDTYGWEKEADGKYRDTSAFVDLRPVLDLISDEFIALRERIEWGYLIPYAISGMMNEHPRTASAAMESDGKETFSEYFHRLMKSLEE